MLKPKTRPKLLPDRPNRRTPPLLSARAQDSRASSLGFPRLSVLRSPSRAAADRRTVPCCPPPLPSAARAEPCSVARRSNEPREAFGWFVPSQARLASIGDGRRNSDMAWSTARRRLNRGSSLKDCRMAILLVWFMIHMDGVLGG